MTERKAAQIANMVYAAHAAKQITAREASKYLEKIEGYMSGAQLRKLSDFLSIQSHNGWK